MARVTTNAALLPASLFLPALAFADNDGSFCFGKGYLAYEVEAHLTPEPLAMFPEP